ncbi:hypothetical protein [Algibacter sp. PT7-4]|uniref:hypothetical protein n=1 Tax=Algibacter ulvanivorans TaxID=3400999 RepID=UPI003AAB649D
MVKYIYDKVDISIAVGSPSFSKATPLKKGKCVGVKLIHISSATPVNQRLNLSVTDGNNPLINATDFRDFIQQGGGYKDGFKPCEFDSSLEVSIDAVAEGNIATADFKAQLIFMIEESCND